MLRQSGITFPFKNNAIHTSVSMLILRIGVMVYNATFEKISAILWQSALLVEETKVPGENHHAACQKSLTNFTT